MEHTQSEDPLHNLIYRVFDVGDKIRNLLNDTEGDSTLDGSLLKQAQRLSDKVETGAIFEPEMIPHLQNLAKALDQVVCEATRGEWFYMDDGVGKPHYREVIADYADVAVDLKKATSELAVRLAEVQRYVRTRNLVRNIQV